MYSEDYTLSVMNRIIGVLFCVRYTKNMFSAQTGSDELLVLLQQSCSLLDVKKFDLESQGGITRDIRLSPFGTIAERCRDS